MMIDVIEKNTRKYINSTNKSQRKNIGQFFTSKRTAMFMSSFIQKNKLKSKVKILDPGCGSLMLSAALLQKIASIKKVKEVELTLYENDTSILDLLYENMQVLKQFAEKENINLNIILKEENYILSNINQWHNPSNYFDIVICNPPYKKIRKISEESNAMKEIVYGQPNLYYLFMAMSVQLLKDGGDFIFIIPRSWTSGLYFTKFREFLFSKMNTKCLHLFKSRNNVFDNEEVLQETMIFYATKDEPNLNEFIKISTAKSNSDLNDRDILYIRNESCIQNFNGRFMFLPVNEEEVDILNHLNQFNSTLKETGFKIKTGPLVEFRNKDFLSNDTQDYPIICTSHLVNGRVLFPNQIEEFQYIKNEAKLKLLENKDYLLLKRLSSKEENRRLQPAIYLRETLSNYEFICIDNHINYLIKTDGNMHRDELLGLYVIFNSSYWDMYYRILNGSTQVNANEINDMPIPEIELIIELGRRAKENQSVDYCDKLIREVLFNENR